MEEIGKLIHEIFNNLKQDKDTLITLCERFQTENNKMKADLEKVTDIITLLVTKSTTGDWYMQSLWGKEFDKLIALLGIELKEEEEE